MGKSLGDVGDSYIEPMPVKEMPSRLSLMARATKDLEAEQLDYDSIVNGERTGHPSMRDQEYLEHSSLFGECRKIEKCPENAFKLYHIDENRSSVCNRRHW